MEDLAPAAVFVLFVAFVLMWAVVIAPRRARRLFRELVNQGYVEVDKNAPELQAAVQTLAPILIQGTLTEGEGVRDTLNALVRTARHTRFVVNTTHTTDDSSDAFTVWQTLVLERRPLAFETEFSIRLTRIGYVGREARFGFSEVSTPGLMPEFAALFTVYSKDGHPVSVPKALQQAMVEVAAILPANRRSNTKFGPAGWGISASEVWLDRKALGAFLAAADRISAAL